MRGLTYSKACLIKESENIIKTRFRGYPFNRPLRSFRVGDLKEFIRLYDKRGG